MADWKTSRYELCALADEIDISAEFRLVCKACCCHLPADKAGILGHLKGKKHLKKLAIFGEREKRRKLNKQQPTRQNKAVTWRLCREGAPNIEEDVRAANVDINKYDNDIGKIVGVNIFRAGNGWNEDETELDKEAFREIIYSHDDIDANYSPGMEALWVGDYSKIDVEEEVDALAVARFDGFNQYGDLNDVIALTDALDDSMPAEELPSRIWDYLVQTMIDYESFHPIPSPIVQDAVVVTRLFIGLETGNGATDTTAADDEIEVTDANEAPRRGGSETAACCANIAVDHNGHRDAHLALHYEVVNFARGISPTEIEKAARDSVIRVVKDVTKMRWPVSRVDLYGSYANGLVLPLGDLDLCLSIEGDVDTIETLYKLARIFRGLPAFVKKVEVARARVPIVKLVFRKGNVHCDICVNNRNTLRSVRFIRKSIREYRALVPLTLVVKYLMAQKGLDDTQTGGLNSYGITLLVLSHLQMYRHNFPDEDMDAQDLGKVLVNFFHFYSCTFNFGTTGICVRKKMYYNREDAHGVPDESQSLCFSIMDPMDRDNEMGTAAYAFPEIIKAFKDAHDGLTGNHQPGSSLLQKILAHKDAPKNTKQQPTHGNASNQPDANGDN